MSKNKKIIFRVSESMFSFLEEFSKAVGVERSSLMRNIVEHYFLIYFSGSSIASYEDLKKKFMDTNATDEQLSPENIEQGN